MRDHRQIKFAGQMTREAEEAQRRQGVEGQKRSGSEDRCEGGLEVLIAELSHENDLRKKVEQAVHLERFAEHRAGDRQGRFRAVRRPGGLEQRVGLNEKLPKTFRLKRPVQRDRHLPGMT